MTAYYDTLIVTFSDPIRILDMMCTDTCDVATLKEWIESYESTRMTPINEHTAVITSEYNMVHVVEWLRKSNTTWCMWWNGSENIPPLPK